MEELARGKTVGLWMILYRFLFYTAQHRAYLEESILARNSRPYQVSLLEELLAVQVLAVEVLAVQNFWRREYFWDWKSFWRTKELILVLVVEL